MATLTVKQKSDIKSTQAAQPAASMTPALRATLASAAQGAAADTALAAVNAAPAPLASAASVTAASDAAAAATAVVTASVAVVTASVATKQNTLQVGCWELQAATTVPGGALLAGANARLLTTELVSTISGASLAAGVVTLPAGTYWIDAWAACNGVGSHMLAVDDGSTIQLLGAVQAAPVGTAAVSRVAGFLTFAGGTLGLRHYIETPAGASDGGLPAVVAWGYTGVEVYAGLTVWRLA